MRYPILQRIARYLCDTPQRQAQMSFAILSLQASRDMKSIATGPLSSNTELSHSEFCPHRLLGPASYSCADANSPSCFFFFFFFFFAEPTELQVTLPQKISEFFLPKQYPAPQKHYTHIESELTGSGPIPKNQI